MLTYVLRRCLQLIPVLFVVSLALFILLRLLPGSPASSAVTWDSPG